MLMHIVNGPKNVFQRKPNGNMLLAEETESIGPILGVMKNQITKVSGEQTTTQETKATSMAGYTHLPRELSQMG